MIDIQVHPELLTVGALQRDPKLAEQMRTRRLQDQLRQAECNRLGCRLLRPLQELTSGYLDLECLRNLRSIVAELELLYLDELVAA